MSDGGSGHIFGGFENGSVLFIDLRKPRFHLTSMFVMIVSIYWTILRVVIERLEC